MCRPDCERRDACRSSVRALESVSMKGPFEDEDSVPVRTQWPLTAVCLQGRRMMQVPPALRTGPLSGWQCGSRNAHRAGSASSCTGPAGRGWVGRWRGAVPDGRYGVLSRMSFPRRFAPRRGLVVSVSSALPSNRACGSPAHGSPTFFTVWLSVSPARAGLAWGR
jgi:hypothetical protein